MENLSKEAKQALRWYFNSKHTNLTVKEVREAMRKTWGNDVMEEIKEWSKR